MSNTSIGRGEKGSKFWMQTLVTVGKEFFENQIKLQIPNISKITWISPEKENEYRELKTKDITEFKELELSFWPDNGPWWDAVGKTDDGTILLVEAKAHIQETKTKCNAKADSSIELIKKSLNETHKALSEGKYNENVWFSKYYQLANRLVFLNKLSSQGVKVKLILLNIVNDSTYIKTSEVEWKKHYDDVFLEILGQIKIPEDTIILNIDVG